MIFEPSHHDAVAGALCNIFAAKTRNQTKFYESMDKLNNYLTCVIRVTVQRASFVLVVVSDNAK